MHFGGNKIALLDAGDLIPISCDLAAEFMSWNQRRMNAVLRPAVPVVDVQIGTANRGDLDLYQHIGTPKRGNFHFANFRPGRGFWLDHRQHGCGHEGKPHGGKKGGPAAILGA